jgi:hypothetical protein
MTPGARGPSFSRHGRGTVFQQSRRDLRRMDLGAVEVDHVVGAAGEEQRGRR